MGIKNIFTHTDYGWYYVACLLPNGDKYLYNFSYRNA